MANRYIPVREQLWSEPVFSPEEGEFIAPTRHQVDLWEAEASNFATTLDELPYGRRDKYDIIATRAYQAGYEQGFENCDCGLLQELNPHLNQSENPTLSELISFIRSRSPWKEWMQPDGCLATAHVELAELCSAAIARWGNKQSNSKLLSPIATKEQVEKYIQWAELEAGPWCEEGWVRNISQHLRQLANNTSTLAEETNNA